jgi:hypothetical protein
MARETIGMSHEDLLAFLGAQRWVTLATLAADGTPVGEIAPALLDGERLSFAVARGSSAHENLERDPRVACAADEFPAYYEIRGATAHGRAELRAGAARLGPDWVEYTIPLDDVFSFDFRKIQQKY